MLTNKRFWILLTGLAASAGLLGPAAAAPGWQPAPAAAPPGASAGWVRAVPAARADWRFRPLRARAERGPHGAERVRAAPAHLSGWRFRPLEPGTRVAGPGLPPGIRPSWLAPRAPVSVPAPRFVGAPAMALHPPLSWVHPGAGPRPAHPRAPGAGSVPAVFRGPDRWTVRPLMARGSAPAALADAPVGPTRFHGYRFRPWRAPRAPAGPSGRVAGPRPPAYLAAPAGPWQGLSPRVRSGIAALARPVAQVRGGLRPLPPGGPVIARVGETPLLRTSWVSRPHTPGVYRFRPARSGAESLIVRVPGHGPGPARALEAARQAEPRADVRVGMTADPPAAPAGPYMRTPPVPAFQVPAMRPHPPAAVARTPDRAALHPAAPARTGTRDRLHRQAVHAAAPPSPVASGLRGAGEGTAGTLWRLPDGRLLHPAPDAGAAGT